jgi:hypothetical protein
MSPSQFTLWLKGFLEAAGNNGLQQYQVNKITDTLNKVEDRKGVLLNPKYPWGPITPDTSNDEMVPYGTICGCNPANGGNGVCGCIMGNTMVPKTSKSNIYTSTTDTSKFDWRYKDKK